MIQSTCRLGPEFDGEQFDFPWEEVFGVHEPGRALISWIRLQPDAIDHERRAKEWLRQQGSSILPNRYASGHDNLTTPIGSSLTRLNPQGKLYVRGDSKIFRFQNGKSESLFLQRKNPRRIAWTVLYRRQHKKGISEVSGALSTRQRNRYYHSCETNAHRLGRSGFHAKTKKDASQLLNKLTDHLLSYRK